MLADGIPFSRLHWWGWVLVVVVAAFLAFRLVGLILNLYDLLRFVVRKLTGRWASLVVGKGARAASRVPAPANRAARRLAERESRRASGRTSR